MLYVCTMAKCEGLVADLQGNRYTVKFCTVEVGTRGLIFRSMCNVLKQLGLKGENEKQGDKFE